MFWILWHTHVSEWKSGDESTFAKKVPLLKELSANMSLMFYLFVGQPPL